MFLIKENDKYVLETYRSVESLFNPDDISVFRKYGVIINREPFNGVTKISFNQNMSDEKIGDIIKRTMKLYSDRR
jgi:hypothetical protein